VVIAVLVRERLDGPGILDRLAGAILGLLLSARRRGCSVCHYEMRDHDNNKA
jgi:hypothetical protein